MSNSKLLARVDIPIYMVKVVSERHILVAGGGGQANTGVKNAVEIYQLPHSSNTSEIFSAVLVNRFYTGSRAIMSGTVFEIDKQFILAGGGINGECLLWRMRLRTNIEHLTENDKEPVHIGNGNARGVRSNSNDALNLRRRRTSSSSSIGGGVGGDDVTDSTEHGSRSRNNSTASNDSRRQSEDISFASGSIFGFELSELSAFKTDFPEKEEPFVKVIRYNDVLSALVTGGADGHIRIWRYPDLVKQTDIRAHTDEIDDLDIHPRGTVIASVSRDSHGYIWDANMGRKQYELKVQMPVIKNSNQPVKYVMRGCRFGLVIDAKPTTYKLFTVHNPATRHKPPHPAYLCKWDANNYTVEKLSSIGPIMVSSMAISDDGRFIGIGTQEGSVEIYIAFSLQRQYNCRQAHNIFVTGLEFLKTCEETQLLTGNNDSSLVSISVDRRIVIHNIPKQRTIGCYGLIFCLAITVMSILFILQYIGL